jgi:nucleoside transporter
VGDLDGAGRPKQRKLLRTRLAGMMFVFFFGLGAWVTTLSTYLMSAPTRGGLNLTTAEVGLIYSTFAFGGMLAPLVIGLLTDRLFRAERVFGVACVLAGGIMFAAGWWCDANFVRMDAVYRACAEGHLVDGRPALEQWARLEAREVPEAEAGPLREQVRLALDRVNDDPAVRRAAADAFGPLFGLMLAYCVCIQLAVTLTTVLTLRNLPDPTHDFSRVRLFGTVGWILAGIAIERLVRPATSDVLYLGAAAALLVGVYAFALPPTRPRGAGRSLAEAFGLPALRLFKDRSFVVFVLIAFFTTVMNQFYVVYGHRYLTDLGVRRPAEMMTVAQVCEVGCMFALPFLGPKHRMKWLMAVGLGGYAVRAVVLTVGWVPGVIALGVPMHGWGYAFFFMVAATYLDREAPPHLRASAQGIITFVSSGIGVWVGNMFAGRVVDRHRVGTMMDWHEIWLVPCVACAVLLVAFAALFHPPPERTNAHP